MPQCQALHLVNYAKLLEHFSDMTTLQMKQASHDPNAIPFRVAVLASLPISLCMAIMGLPDVGHGESAAFRSLYFVAYLAWVFPLTTLQRSLWRNRWSWWAMALGLLLVTYGMSLVNSYLGASLAVSLDIEKTIVWSRLFRGLDGCWLALIAFCAIHAGLNYYVAFQRESMRAAQALSLARDAQLRALRYQLHPHFLFNTLNAVSALVAGERNREANRMIAQLGDFLRATLESEDCHEHALAEELALTENYLNIEKARLGERLQIDVHIGPDVLQAFVPFLLLQPLMENAIRHGISRRTTAGRLGLRITREGENLLIRLDNDGVPASANDVPADPSGKTGGVGMRNVSERLAQLYGEAHRFSFAEREDGGFEVSMVLPCRVAASAVSTWTDAA